MTASEIALVAPEAAAAVPVRDRHRALMSAFPTGVAVVTTTDRAGSPVGMTSSSLTSVSLAPPTLLVCLRTDSRTCRAVLDRRRFGLNLLRAESRRTAELFAAPVDDRFGRVRWNPSPSGMPWLVDAAFAVAECRVVDVLEVGDHAVVFGEITDSDQEVAAPLLYGMRRYARWRQPGHHG